MNTQEIYRFLNRGLPIIGSGAIATAPPPSAGNLGAFFWETGDPNFPNGRLWEYRYVFKNAGTDYFNLGRPASLVNLFALTSNKTIELLVKPASLSSGIILGLSEGAGKSQFSLLNQPSGQLQVAVGGVNAFTPNTYSANQWVKVKVTQIGNTFKISMDGQDSAYFAVGTETTTSNLFIGGRTDGTILNFEGSVAYLDMRDGVGNRVDAVDMNNPTQWDGGASGTTWAGNPFTVTDGSPTGVRVVDLVPYQYTDNIIGAGDIANAPLPSADLKGKFYLEIGDPNFPNGRLWKYKERKKTGATQTIIAIGDSLTGGWPFSSPWFGVTNKPNFTETNKGWAGTTSDLFLSRVTSSLAENPSLILYSIFTPNDGNPTQLIADTQKARFLQAVNICRLNGIQIIPTWVCPNNNYNLAQDNLRKEVLEYASALMGSKVNLLPAVSQGISPDRYIPALNYDDVHPTEAGYLEMRDLYIPMTDSLYVDYFIEPDQFQ